ncbi:hypothetical protein MLD38_010909 [Melastoma candidum]|uniref:Uncharacterized protein n=1 Tax=Melastoma candidum TaxID=119954 RepID=A0ACB9R1W7_9MYRT|nr:hypothetical protein MLD38_010909 [Melastoma candidum]
MRPIKNVLWHKVVLVCRPVTPSSAEDPQILQKRQSKLRMEGGIRALLGSVRCGPNVLSQVAWGIANFAKCESRLATQGIVHNANDEAAPIRCHIVLALCDLVQHGKDGFLSSA